MNLESQIAQIVQAKGAQLYDTATVQENDRTVFRVFITKKGGVDLDVCEAVSRELAPFLDVYPPVQGAYFLEVSSPGIERSLSKPHHFSYATGENVEIKSTEKVSYKGVLKAFDGECVILTTPGGDVTLALDEIRKARTYFEW